MEDFDLTLNKLITQIYETALEPSLWPELLQQFSDLMLAISPSIPLDEHPLIGLLLGHLQRGVAMSEKLNIHNEIHHFEQNLFQQIPLPMLVLSPTGRVLQENQQAHQFIDSQKLMTIHDGKLVVEKRSQQSQFEEILGKLSQPSLQYSQQTMRLRDNYQSLPVSINLSRISDQYDLKGNILLLVASHEPNKLPDLVIIAEHFSLTPAEVRLLKKLILSKTLHQIAEEHSVSIHTVRSQLKSIFKKTNCRRQSELIKLIINSPLRPSLITERSLSTKYGFNAPCYHNKITLRDNRQLGYADTGSRKGTVVIMLHPSTGSRLQQHPDESILFDLKIRVITPDRPGYGLSDANPQLSLLNYADDLLELAEQLNLERFVLASYCGGAPYALAATKKLADRVLHTILISPITPYDKMNLFHGVKSSNKLLAKIALNFPAALQPLLDLIARNLLTDPERYFDQVYCHLCESDAAALSEPEVTENILISLREAMRQGTTAFSKELCLLSQEWNIDFSSITQAISIWHGTLDQHVNIDLVRQLESSLANAVLYEVEEQGHILIYYRWREILQSIRQ